MAASLPALAPVPALRRFSRYYTQRIGALEAGLLGSPLPLPAARVLYEVAQRQPVTASRLAETLGLDPGYLSRLLAGLGRRKLVRAQRSAQDRRELQLRLSPAGQRQFALLDRGADAQAAELLQPLPAAAQQRLARSLAEAQSLLGGMEPPAVPARLRAPRPGDLGWVVHRHGVLYAREYGWDSTFEALVARIGADFLDHHDSSCERGWIAARGEEILGSVFLVKQGETVGKLRLLYVEPSARGQGLGRTLVAACVAFARRAGYQKITLWTMSALESARRIYEAAGFRLVEQQPTRSFGHNLVAQNWELELRGAGEPGLNVRPARAPAGPAPPAARRRPGRIGPAR